VKPAIKVAAVKTEAKPITRPPMKVAANLALKEAALKPAVKSERIHSHPTMCLHCHLIVEMFHERGADPVKGAWQCPRCGHKYLFSHWKSRHGVNPKRPEVAVRILLGKIGRRRLSNAQPVASLFILRLIGA
jgi:transposase-like protein